MSYFSELHRLEKERQFVKAVKLNEELLEHLASSLGWFLNQCEKNGNFPPNFDQIRQSVRKAQELMESLPVDQPIGNAKNYQPKRYQNLVNLGEPSQ